MAASSFQRGRGVAKYTDQNVWRASVAFYNLNLAGRAFDGKDWNQLRVSLIDLFTGLLKDKENTLGVFLKGVGNWSDLLSRQGRIRLELALVDAFESIGAMKHGPPKFFWGSDNTMAAFRHDVDVTHLEPLKNMKGVNQLRVVDRFEVIGCTTHGQCSLSPVTSHISALTSCIFFTI